MVNKPLSILIAAVSVSMTVWAIMFGVSPELLPTFLGGDGQDQDLVQGRPILPAYSDSKKLSKAVARRLTLLGLEHQDIIRTEVAELSSPAGTWPIDITELYLPQDLTTERVEGVLKAIPNPGEAELTWSTKKHHDFTVSLEASLDRVPTLVVKMVPWMKARSPASSLQTPQIALLITGVGHKWYPNDRLLKVEPPLTVAILPYGAYSLEWAEQAREVGKEIMVDWTETKGEAQTHSSFDRISAVPFRRGVLVPHWLAGDAQRLGELVSLTRSNTLTFVSTGAAAITNAQADGVLSGRALALTSGGQKVLSRELVRLQNMALRDGAAIGTIAPRPSELGQLISWLTGLTRAGYEPVVVSRALHHLVDEG